MVLVHCDFMDSVEMSSEPTERCGGICLLCDFCEVGDCGLVVSPPCFQLGGCSFPRQPLSCEVSQRMGMRVVFRFFLCAWLRMAMMCFRLAVWPGAGVKEMYWLCAFLRSWVLRGGYL